MIWGVSDASDSKSGSSMTNESICWATGASWSVSESSAPGVLPLVLAWWAAGCTSLRLLDSVSFNGTFGSVMWITGLKQELHDITNVDPLLGSAVLTGNRGLVQPVTLGFPKKRELTVSVQAHCQHLCCVWQEEQLAFPPLHHWWPWRLRWTGGISAEGSWAPCRQGPVRPGIPTPLGFLCLQRRWNQQQAETNVQNKAFILKCTIKVLLDQSYILLIKAQ